MIDPAVHRRARAVARLDHAIERLHRAREVLVNAVELLPHAPHLDALGKPYTARPGHPLAYEVAIDRLITDAEGALAVLLRDARTTASPS